MIKISASRPHKTLRPSDADFTFSPDGLRLVPRAAFEVNDQCPQAYKLVIAECINNGWLNPVAHMRDVEYTMELLRK
jgi:putative heme iron utilization protein